MSTEPELKAHKVHVDCEQYIAIAYDDSYGTSPIGMFGPYAELKEAAAAATQYVSEGLEWESRRRVEIAWMSAEPTIEVDMVVSAPRKQADDA